MWKMLSQFVLPTLLAFSAGVFPGIAFAADEWKPIPPFSRQALIAHRGASGDAPEHTRSAYELALKQGADFVEPDLQVTKDGVLVCLHDLTLERTTDVATRFPDRAKIVNEKKTWPVADFTLAEIQTLDAGSWKGRQFANARVLTLQEAIDIVKGKAGLCPETKSPETYGKLGFSMEKLLVEVLKKNGLDKPGAEPKTPILIQSSSKKSLISLRNDYACKLALLSLNGSAPVDTEKLKVTKTFADGIALSKPVVMAHPEIVKEAHALGLSVTIATFRSGDVGKFKNVREEMAYFLDLNVDALFTDNPDQFPRK